jgi:outer membrane receptor protein involved in Fe transport
VTQFFNGSVQYALSRGMNDTAGLNWMPPNNYDMSQEYARADADQRHRFDLLGTINPGSLFNLGIALALYSGRPYSIVTGHDDFNTGSANARPAGVPRNSLDGPGYADLDLRWSRDIHLTGTSKEGSAVTVGIDAFNVLNRVNPSRYIGTLTSPFFGRAVSAQPPRRIQLSLRVRF